MFSFEANLFFAISRYLSVISTPTIFASGSFSEIFSVNIPVPHARSNIDLHCGIFLRISFFQYLSLAKVVWFTILS
jgi:hypothetical protein